MDKELLTVKDIMVMLKCCRATIYNHLSKGLFPKPIYISSKMLRWKKSVVEKWIKSESRDERKQFNPRFAPEIKKCNNTLEIKTASRKNQPL